MNFGQIIQLTTLILSTFATVISLVTYLTNKKRSLEAHIPQFVINKITKFGDKHYTMLIKNLKDNFVVIEKVYSTEGILCEYEGVMNIEVEKTNGREVVSTTNFEGHSIDIRVLNGEQFQSKIFIEGIDFTGRKFVISTPTIFFNNYRIINKSLQKQYLNFIKK